MIGIRLPAGANKCFFFSPVQSVPSSYPTTYLVGIGGSSPEVKLSVRQIARLPLQRRCSEWVELHLSSPYTFLEWRLIKRIDGFTFTFIVLFYPLPLHFNHF